MKRDISSFNHACSGADSSLLFILATTGVVGGLIFLGMLYQMIFLSAGNTYGLIFRSSAFALLAHSLFVGSIFYTWVAGWIMIVYALSVTD
jgi:hypothetical protein